MIGVHCERVVRGEEKGGGRGGGERGDQMWKGRKRGKRARE